VTAVWILLAVALLGPAPLVRRARRRRLALRSRITELDALDDRDFLLRIEAVFWRLGYRVQSRPNDASRGADLILAKGGVTTAVRARGQNAIAEVAAARERYRCQGALAVTNGSFGGRARREAQKLGVELWERDDLIDALLAAA
jgi:HJR/Mrr/RecB family endonuclease